MPEFLDPPKIKTGNGIPGVNATAPGKLARPRPPLELKPPTPTQRLPKKPLNIPNPKPDLPNIPKPKRRPTGGRVRGGGFAASKGGKAAGKKLGFKSVGGKVLPVLGYASLAYDVIGLAEDAAPGVQSWLTGGWKGKTPGTIVENPVKGQCPGVSYSVDFFWNDPYGNTGQVNWYGAAGPIQEVRVYQYTVRHGLPHYRVTIVNGSGTELPFHQIGPLLTTDSWWTEYTLIGGGVDNCAYETVSQPHPMTETPTKQTSLPPPDIAPSPSFRSPQRFNDTTAPTAPKNPTINLSPPGDLAPTSSIPSPEKTPATPNQPAQPNPDDETPPKPTPTGDSCSLDPCQAAQGNQLDSIKDDTEHIDEVRDRLENLLDYAQDAYRHEQIMSKLEMICDELKKDEEEDSEKPELEIVKVPYARCDSESPEIKYYSFNVPKDSVPDEQIELFLESATHAILQCYEPEKIVALPEQYDLKLRSKNPQLVCCFRERASSGKWKDKGYRISIPHYNGQQNKRPNISDYNRGNVLVRHYLDDKSQVNFYAASIPEGQRVLNQILKYIPRDLQNSDVPTSFVETKKKLSRMKVTFFNAKYYPSGDERTAPDWTVWYEGRESYGRGI